LDNPVLPQNAKILECTADHEIYYYYYITMHKFMVATIIENLSFNLLYEHSLSANMIKCIMCSVSTECNADFV